MHGYLNTAGMYGIRNDPGVVKHRISNSAVLKRLQRVGMMEPYLLYLLVGSRE
jgi:hypothetical protein